MPSLRALKREAALPLRVRGPVDFFALARLAASCLRDAIGFESSRAALGTVRRKVAGYRRDGSYKINVGVIPRNGPCRAESARPAQRVTDYLSFTNEAAAEPEGDPAHPTECKGKRGPSDMHKHFASTAFMVG